MGYWKDDYHNAMREIKRKQMFERMEAKDTMREDMEIKARLNRGEKVSVDVVDPKDGKMKKVHFLPK